MRAAIRLSVLSRFPVVTVFPTVSNTAAIAIDTTARMPTATTTSISVNPRPPVPVLNLTTSPLPP
jgi:phosphopantothenate synthetase